MNVQELSQFQATVWEYYRQHGRHDLPWRQPGADGQFDPYRVLVSEVMLQQTQVARVIPKYYEFLVAFPSVQALAAAELGDVLKVWSGLGYNRRAKFLWQAAQMIAAEYKGNFPSNKADLVALSGIGVNTAGALIAYAFNQPAVFIETNIRTVYIHHFFNDQQSIPDSEILRLVEATLPQAGKSSDRSRKAGFEFISKGNDEKPGTRVSHYRVWYWALMDYGVYLKATHGNLNKLSKTYVKQSRFHGSKRQVRGRVIRALRDAPMSQNALQQHIPDERLSTVLQDLVGEGLIRKTKNTYTL